MTAHSKPVHIGRSTQVWDVVIQNEAQLLISSGRITLMVLPRESVQFQLSQSLPQGWGVLGGWKHVTYNVTAVVPRDSGGKSTASEPRSP